MSGFSKIKSATAWLVVAVIMVDKASKISVFGLQVHSDVAVVHPSRSPPVASPTPPDVVSDPHKPGLQKPVAQLANVQQAQLNGLPPSISNQGSKLTPSSELPQNKRSKSFRPQKTSNRADDESPADICVHGLQPKMVAVSAENAVSLARYLQQYPEFTGERGAENTWNTGDLLHIGRANGPTLQGLKSLASITGASWASKETGSHTQRITGPKDLLQQLQNFQRDGSDSTFTITGWKRQYKVESCK